MSGAMRPTNWKEEEMKYYCTNKNCEGKFAMVMGVGEPEEPRFIENRVCSFEIDENGLTLGMEDMEDESHGRVVCPYCGKSATVRKE